MSEPTPQTPLTVVARAPFHIYYEGSAFSVSAKNRVGPFDILPGHADFFSMLVPCTITIDTGAEQLSFEIYSGMLTVRSDQVLLFVNM
jgi:F0F1-type ATP synthase epsilon subunit